MPNDGPGAPAPKSLTEALREIEVFADLTDDQLGWFINHASEEFYPAGTLILREGDIAETLNVILAGQIRYQSSNPELPVFLGHAGTVTGVLPYSRLKKYAGNVHAILPVRVVRLHRDLFPEMLERIPVLGPRLVAVMADRIRDVTRLGQQR